VKKCIRELSFSLVSLCALSDEIRLSAEVLIGFQPSGILLTWLENNKHIHHCTPRSAPLHDNTDAAQINHILIHQDPSLEKAPEIANSSRLKEQYYLLTKRKICHNLFTSCMVFFLKHTLFEYT